MQSSARNLLMWVTLMCGTNGQSATVLWDGGGGDLSWQNATNWSGDALPGIADDVVINASGNITVVSSANVTIASLQCSNNLMLEGGTFRMVAGDSVVQGELSVSGTPVLSASGATTTVTVAGAVNVDGAGLEAIEGATLSLPTLTAYSKGTACVLRPWRASGAGSVLNLSGLVSLTGGSCQGLDVQALGGGTVLLTSLSAIADGTVLFLADGTNSLVDLSSMTGSLTTTRNVTLEARNAGVIQVPLMTGGPNVSVIVKSGGVLPVVQLHRLKGITVDGMNIEFTALTNLNAGNLRVSGGGTLALPALASHSQGSGCAVNFWEATGAGSVLDVSSLTELVGGSCGYLAFEARSGGTIVLTNLGAIAEGTLTFLAEGPGSLVDLSSLSNSAATLRNLSFEARDAGAISIPLLTGGPTVIVTLRSGGVMPVAQMSRLRGATVDAMAVDFLALTNLNTGNLIASGGALVTAPVLTSHNQGSGCAVNWWQATGAGSVLDLSSLVTLTGGSCGRLNIEALAGGKIILTNLPVITEGTLIFLADGTNSVIELDALQESLATLRSVTLEARNAGTILVPSLAGGHTLNVTLASGGVMALSQMNQLNAITIRSTTVAFPALTSLNTGSLVVSDGAVVTFPNVMNHDQGDGCTVNTWEVSHPGSVLDLSSLTNLAGSTCGSLAIRALAGGTANLSKLATVSEGDVSFLADGTNSLVSLDALKESMALLHQVAFEARNGGTIQSPLFHGGPTVSVALNSAGIMPVAQLARLRGIDISGMTVSFSALTNFDGGRVELTDNAIVTIPNLTSYQQGTSCTPDTWLISGGSILDLPGLNELSGGTCSWVDIRTVGGGQLLMGNLTDIPSRTVFLRADGTGSVIDLHSLSNFVNASSASRLTATNGGTILLPQPVVFSGVTINIAPGTPDLPPAVLGTNMVLYGAPWHSYRVEVRDTGSAASPWHFFQRVPLTNAFQVIAPPAGTNREFRAYEFVADPFGLELTVHGGTNAQLVLYSPTNETFEVQSATNLNPVVNWETLDTVTMTNTFRIFPPQPVDAPQRYFRADAMASSSQDQ